MDDETRRSLERFIERMKTMREGPTDGSSSPRAERPRLVIVTNANAGQFNQPTKRRGRKPMLKLGGNVVAFRPRAAPAVEAPEDAVQVRMSEIMAPFMAFLDRKAAEREARLQACLTQTRREPAPAAVKPPRKQKPKAAPLPPAEDDADARLRSFFERINALPIGAMSDKGKGPTGGA